ncbi:MAG: hypothetical protein CTY12_04930 [Methylotenera sp.]|nr:MAG: hypothetical protein CTY12_04930 [Methylotenera sp.]
MDIDIDFPSNFDPNKIFTNAIPASMVKKGAITKHPCGQYFQNIAIDPNTTVASIPYEEAQLLGYFKIDFLHNSALDLISSKEEMRRLINEDPDWDLLLNEHHVFKLIHINKHAELLKQVRPRSVLELADCLALIRPGKRQLLSHYLHNKERVRKQLYTKTTEYYFKQSHAIAYALTIKLQLHLIQQGRL